MLYQFLLYNSVNPLWLSQCRICLKCGRPGFDPWVGKIPWRRAWQPIPVFRPGESPWTEEPGGLQSMGLQRAGRDCTTKHVHVHAHTHTHISVQFICSVMSDSLRPHGLQHAGLPCPSPTPGAYSNLCPSSWWCHPTMSSSVIPFSSCFQTFPTSVSFLMSWLFASGGQSIGASVWVLPVNIQDWFPLGLTGWISLQSKGFSRVFSNTTVEKHKSFGDQLSL